MNQELILQDFVIVILAKNHKPSLLTLDFLKCSGTVTSDWELARQPINANNISQVVFTNGIAITAEPQRIMFAQSIRNVSGESILIPEIARKYAQALPNMELKAVGINPRGYVPFATGAQNNAREYITRNLLSPGAWQSVGEAPPRASIDFTYKLQRAPFHLKVVEAALQPENQSEAMTPIIMFSGSFSYELKSENNSEKLAQLDSALNNWQSDLGEYCNIINNNFLGQASAQKVLPTSEYNLKINDNLERNNLFTLNG